MPYEVREEDGEFCVYKEGDSQSLGCHLTRTDAYAQITAIESGEGTKVLVVKSHGDIYVMDGTAQLLDRTLAKQFNTKDSQRLMLLVTSNAYRDRENEIIREKALQQYVESSWKDNEFVGDNPLLVWHGGEPIGDIIYADMEGPFLIEVARERPNATVNLAREGEEPVMAEIKKVWDALSQQSDIAASHEFFYVRADRDDKMYERILKAETSVLPRDAAANVFTSAQVLEEINE